mgnify:CR=1 FL=1
MGHEPDHLPLLHDDQATKDWFYVRVDRSRNPFEGWVTADAISVRDP